ncbi:MAG: rhomboid family intramembrane serine protease [Ideonella sp.]|jgi:membrane associated rhomboid family serine protease|nr:rhomboid family intramembrane serine protease [Ideonella sp.]MBL0151453.1 rhomboid family intramembrane serine protease [Ideonella sp.]
MPPLPPVTKALLLICTAVFCLQQVVPYLDALLALWPITSGRFWPWQMVSYAFLHGSFEHLLFNMLGLWMFGAELELLWGQKRYLHLLLASVVAASVAQLAVTFLMGSLGPTVGASGALYGLLLGYALMFPNRRFDLVGFLPMLLLMAPFQALNLVGMVLFVMLLTNRNAVPVPPIPVTAKTMVALYGGLELVMGVLFRSSGIAHFAHLGGMLGAWLLIKYWRGQSPLSGRRRR